MKNTIHFVITGGTIDSHYDCMKDTAVPLKISAIPAFVQSLKLYGGGIYSSMHER